MRNIAYPYNFDYLDLSWALNKPHFSTVIRSPPHHISSSGETHTHTETIALKVVVLVGFMEQLGI